MELFTPVQNHNIPERSYKQFDSQVIDRQVADLQTSGVEEEINLKTMKSMPVSKVLSSTEMATLQNLFGFEKKEGSLLYGRSEIQQIHKGYLLDIIG